MSRSEQERERRETVERFHQLKDVEEDYETNKAATSSTEERQRLMNEMSAFRRKHRLADIERGKRAPGFGVQMQQIMWARWVEVAASHTAGAQSSFEQITESDASSLTEELRQSLVAISASASTVEAVYEDVKYLIPPRPRLDTAPARIADVLATVFGLGQEQAAGQASKLEWLFDRRNEALHPYAEPEAPRPHPSGHNTSAEASRFNARESLAALDIALEVLMWAENPPAPANRWVARWASLRHNYHRDVIGPIREWARGYGVA